MTPILPRGRGGCAADAGRGHAGAATRYGARDGPEERQRQREGEGGPPSDHGSRSGAPSTHRPRPAWGGGRALAGAETLPAGARSPAHPSDSNAGRESTESQERPNGRSWEGPRNRSEGRSRPGHRADQAGLGPHGEAKPGYRPRPGSARRISCTTRREPRWPVATTRSATSRYRGSLTASSSSMRARGSAACNIGRPRSRDVR